MVLRQQIIDLLKSKGQLSLKEIYSALPGFKQENIRSTLNQEVKKGKIIQRTGRGSYNLINY